jgi:serine/threonine protein kinase
MNASLDMAQPEAELPLEVEGYRPLFELGRGGMARVYLAQRTTHGLRRLVVLKVLDPTLATSPDMRSAFRREAVLCARLNHPNIVQVFEVHEDSASPMIVMEYVEGITLSQILNKVDGRLPFRLHVHIIIQALAGLHYFHELRGDDGQAEEPVHRDVSPQNVIVMHEGAVKVLDFGIAKVQGVAPEDTTKAGIIKGKLSYMPAEQLSGDDSIDRRADIFAAGVMLWEAFARRRMWQGHTQHETVAALISGKIPSIREACPWISSKWEQIIMRAVAGKREDRYATALDLQVDMENNLAELGGVVQQRELATFMKTEFAAMRSERNRVVEAEARKAPVALATVLSQPTTGVRTLSVTPSGSNHSTELMAPQSSWGRRLPWIALLGLASAAALYIGLQARSNGMAAGPVQGQGAEERMITLSITASPPEAQVRFDGKSVDANPWSTRIPPSDRTVRVEVSAAGHRSFTQDVILRADTSLSVQLEALPAAAPEPAPSASVSARSKSHVRAKVAFVPPAPAASPATPTAKSNCVPPYTLDAEGVKTFKPECL